MFWKFGFHNASSVDALLDKGDVALESLLDEDDLLQECKAQNTRLVEYFRRLDVLQQLLGYVTGNIVGEGDRKSKYPHVAAEVLCSDIWSIVETCLANAEQILAPFWGTILDRRPEDLKILNTVTSQFAKINATFLGKKPAEMLSFIKSQPVVVERLLSHIETPAFVDLLMRIIQCDGLETSAGILDWLSAEKFIPRLVDMLSPFHSTNVHSVTAELVKGIISISAPSPGAGVADSADSMLASNLFARQLAQKANIEKLVSFILNDYAGPSQNSEDEPKNLYTAQAPPTSPVRTQKPTDQDIISSSVHSIAVVVELIRKNNSDYWEPYLFHTIRNRLINAQQHLNDYDGDSRVFLEKTMEQLADRLGVVHLGTLLDIMSEKLDRFQNLLTSPRSSTSPFLTTVGALEPFTFERFRICELYAELLHCSNMSLVNRSERFDNLYDHEGRLQGGLAALEQLGRIVTIGPERNGQDLPTDRENDLEPAQELPISVASVSLSTNSDEDEIMSPDEDSDEDGSGSSDEDMMAELGMSDDTDGPLSLVIPSPPNEFPAPIGRAVLERTRRLSSASANSSSARFRPRSTSSRRSAFYSHPVRPLGSMTIGDKLKQRFRDTMLLNTVIDLFFSFPWNNFLHTVVYDLLHQILTGRTDSGLNRELIIALFRDAELPQKIIAGQRRNDIESSKSKGVRLGYMGHLTLLSDDVVNAMQHYPPDMRLQLAQYVPQPEWDDYISGRYHETKKKDTSLLGGGRPVITGNLRSGLRWRVDEEDNTGLGIEQQPDSERSMGTEQLTGEFRRVIKVTRENSADFGPAVAQTTETRENVDSRFTQYLAQEISSSVTFVSDGSDEEDEEGGWLSQSSFNSNPPSVSSRDRSLSRSTSNMNSFDDSFIPTISTHNNSPFEDQMFEDDERFGPFSDAAATNGNDPFAVDENEDNGFDSFGDFGDFQTADGQSTSMGDSWTFASDASNSSDSEGDSVDVTNHLRSTSDQKRTQISDNGSSTS